MKQIKLFFILKNIYLFLSSMSVSVLLTCKYPHICLVPVEVREGISFSEMGITDTCELPYGCWEPNLGSLQKQQVLLTMSNFSVPYTYFLKK